MILYLVIWLTIDIKVSSLLLLITFVYAYDDLDLKRGLIQLIYMLE